MNSYNKNKPTIIWDWNGTLLNDIAICLETMNQLLNERNLSPLSFNRYREIFTFPVKEYYKEAGFDFNKEPFEKPAIDFIENFHKRLPEAALFENTKTTLANLNKQGYNMLILSAMEEESLRKSVSQLGIEPYFKEIAGINNHFAHSKIERGQQLISELNINLNNTLLIGDTLHDKEVADALGCECILIANGHQNENRLRINGNKVYHSLAETENVIKSILPT